MVVSASHFKAVTNGYEQRTDGLWTHTGKFVVRQGPVELPSGSVGTAELASGAAQAQIGAVAFSAGWSTTTAGVWLGTPLATGSIACSGVLCRVECSVSLSHSVVAAAYYTGLWYDGAVQVGLTIVNQPVANYQVPHAWTFYIQPPAGNHIFGLAVHNATAGTLSIFAGVTSVLYVTEQRA